MAGDVFGLTSSQLPASSAQVATAQPVISVNFDDPAGDSTLPVVTWPSGDQEESDDLSPGSDALYRLSVAPGPSFLQLNMSVEILPAGDSVQLLAFDDAGDVLVNSSQITVSQSSTVALTLGGPVSIPDGVAYVAVLVGGQTSSSTAAPDITCNLQVTTQTIANPLTIAPADGGNPVGLLVENVEPVITSALPGTGIGSSGTSQGTGTGGTTGTASSSSGLATGPMSSGFGLLTATSHGASTASPSPPPAVGVGAGGTTQGTLGGRDPQSAPSPSISIDVGPLPASPYQPVAGVFSVGATLQQVDEVDATRVEMSLVRLTSDQWPGIRTSDFLDIVTDRAGDLDVTVVSLPSDSPGPSRPGSHPSAAPRSEVEAVDGRSVALRTALPVPPIAADPMWGGLLTTAATLPPIDEYDRRPDGALPTNPRCVATTDERSSGWEGRRAEAMFLGLSGSAALGAALYAPDLAVAVRRAVRARAATAARGDDAR